MQVEPIINARFKQFRQKNELESMKDGDAFERFVNHTILSFHQPDAFGADTELLDFVSVGGTADMGIDGIAIKVENIIIKSKSEIDDIIRVNRSKRINVEFVFIQSKYKTKFDKGELNNFSDGVRDFLSENHNFPMNNEVKALLELKEYLLSDKLAIMWESNPQITLYYVTMGKWEKPHDLVGVVKMFEQDINKLNIYSKTNFKFIDSEALKDTYDSVQNTFNTTIDTRYTMPLTYVEGVSNSCLSLVFGDELIKIISTDDKIIRKSLFNDNVRDFQGLNNVNLEIIETIKSNPEKFIVLNNGITIVCDEFKQNNTKLTVYNPQIVNGCQTCHVLYEAFKSDMDLSKVPISVRFISTSDEDIVNEIVRGTNRQNIVLEEAFEATKKFHKNLEEFFIAYPQDLDKIYYERRSKQFQHNPTIKQTEKINLKVLTQYFIGMFLNKPHVSHRHEAILLKEHGSSVFQDFHSKLPYFTAAYSFIKLEKYLRDNNINKIIKTYKPQILMMFRQSVAGYVPPLNKESSLDKHCEEVLSYLKDSEKLKNRLDEITDLFLVSMNKWENELGKSRSATKDVEEFTKHLLKEVNSTFHRTVQAVEESQYMGEVLSTIKDKYGKYYGFISKAPENIFFHSKDNEQFDFSNLRGSKVIYTTKVDPKTNSLKAIILEKI